MDFFQIVSSGALALVFVYLVSRLASAAYFKSKHKFLKGD